MNKHETRKIKLEVEIPAVIYMALLENKMRDQEDILERAKRGTVEALSLIHISEPTRRS